MPVPPMRTRAGPRQLPCIPWCCFSLSSQLPSDIAQVVLLACQQQGVGGLYLRLAAATFPNSLLLSCDVGTASRRCGAALGTGQLSAGLCYNWDGEIKNGKAVWTQFADTWS